MTEIAIGEAHARYRTTEVALVFLVEIEAGFERNALDRRADVLAANLERIAGQPHVAHRTGARKLHPACRAAAIQHPACAPSAVETYKFEHLAAYKPTSPVRID